VSSRQPERKALGSAVWCQFELLTIWAQEGGQECGAALANMGGLRMQVREETHAEDAYTTTEKLLCNVC